MQITAVLTRAALAAMVAVAVFGQSVSVSDKPVRVGGNEQQGKIVKMVRPVYPPEAKAAGVEGLVRLEVQIGKDGKVTDTKVLEGHEQLLESAVTAVSKWEWRPTLLNGEPVAVITDVDVKYTLAK